MIPWRPSLFLPVRVLSRVFLRFFLTRLLSARRAGDLRFCNELVDIEEPQAFA